MSEDTPKNCEFATFTDETVTLAAFRSYVSANAGGKSVDPSLVMVAPYKEIEYFNSPKGLIVFAHQDTFDSQVDGVHPNTIGKSIENERNIIEPLKGKHSGPSGYNVHYMTRRSQGSLILEAFGKMIHGGDEEAISVSTKKSFTLVFHNTVNGLIIGAIEGDSRVCIIRPKHLQVVKSECEVAA